MLWLRNCKKAGIDSKFVWLLKSNCQEKLLLFYLSELTCLGTFVFELGAIIWDQIMQFSYFSTTALRFFLQQNSPHFIILSCVHFIKLHIIWQCVPDPIFIPCFFSDLWWTVFQDFLIRITHFLIRIIQQVHNIVIHVLGIWQIIC